MLFVVGAHVMIFLFFGCIVCSLRCVLRSYAKTFKLMLVGRKRSSRLIESSWVYNWAKKNPAFVTIDDDGDSYKALGIVSGVPCLRRKYVEACLANLKLRGPHQGLVWTYVTRGWKPIEC